MYYFFFSSRRRHTRSKRDWSSDVCSSDLRPGGLTFAGRAEHFSDGGLIGRVGSFGGAGLISRAGLLAFAMLMTAMLAGLSFVLHRRWRAADGEFAKRLGARERWGTLAERVARRLCGG